MPTRAHLLRLIDGLLVLPDEHARAFSAAFDHNEDKNIMLNLNSFQREHYRRVLEEHRIRALEEGMAKGVERGIQTGLAKGLEKGVEKGIEKGIEKGEARLLERQLARRFGPLPAAISAQISTATPGQLEQWGDRVLDATTLDEVFGD